MPFEQPTGRAKRLKQLLSLLGTSITLLSFQNVLTAYQHIITTSSDEGTQEVGRPFSKRKTRSRQFTLEFGSHIVSDTVNLISRRFEMSELCPGCRFAPAGPKKASTCMKRIKALLLDDTNTSTENVTRFVSTDRPGFCTLCHPDACSDARKRFWRLDAAAPRVQQTIDPHFLTSIPEIFRFPPTQIDNITSFLSHKENVYPQRQYFFEFNPSIVQLPADQRQVVDGRRSVYLASYRVSTLHNCMADENDVLLMIGGSWPRPHGINYLGLAILDENFEILRDTVVDGVAAMKKYADPRLFLLHNQIYIASFHRIYPIWVVPPLNIATDEFKRIDGGSNPTTDLSNFLRVYHRSFGSCSNEKRIQLKAKNLNYFIDTETGQTMLETIPGGPKEQVDLNAECTRSKVMDEMKNFVFPNVTIEALLPSFGSNEELEFARMGMHASPVTGERGSACCIQIAHPTTNESLWLGISHSKTRFDQKTKGTDNSITANQFFSAFYAFRSVAPYDTVAVSGKFCLGFAKNSNSDKKIKNPYVNMQVEPLLLGNSTYNCPRIHFVTGMMEKANDSSKIVISYGINDCIPTMLVVNKADILRMLFQPETIE